MQQKLILGEPKKAIARLTFSKRLSCYKCILSRSERDAWEIILEKRK